MSPTMQVEIVSLDRAVFSGHASFMVVPGAQGDMGILPGHAPLMSELRAGWIRVTQGDPAAEERFYVSSGAVEVLPERVTVVLDVVLLTRDEALETALLEQEARENLLRARVCALEYAQLEASLAKALHDLKNSQHLLPNKRLPKGR